MTIYGYARVSTDGQSLEAQQAALSAAGAEKVFAEKVSGAVTDRRALAKAVAAIDQGDVLLVTKLDRLARSTRDLLNTLAAIGDRGAGFKSLGDPWADTTTTRQADDYGPREIGRIRASFNPGPDQRGARTSEGTRSAVRAQVEAD